MFQREKKKENKNNNFTTPTKLTRAEPLPPAILYSADSKISSQSNRTNPAVDVNVKVSPEVHPGLSRGLSVPGSRATHFSNRTGKKKEAVVVVSQLLYFFVHCNCNFLGLVLVWER